MKTPVNLHSSSNPYELGLSNSKHRLAPEVVKALSARRKTHLKLLALQNQNDLTPGIKKELLEARRSIYRSVTEPMGLNFDKLSVDLIDVINKKSAHVSDAIKERINERAKFGGIVKEPPLPPAPPEPIDHSFWWAQTLPFLAPGTSADFRDDGLHFFGHASVRDYDGELHTSFGATALFGLAPARRPTSPTGRFISSPYIELFGGITAYAPNWDVLQGNGIAECNLFLKQTIYQWKLGENGSILTPVAQAESNDPWIYLKNTGYSRYGSMPGFKPLPAVGFNQGQFAALEPTFARLPVILVDFPSC